MEIKISDEDADKVKREAKRILSQNPNLDPTCLRSGSDGKIHSVTISEKTEGVKREVEK